MLGLDPRTSDDHGAGTADPDLLARISEMTKAIDDLARQIGELTESLAPSLMNLFGCG